MARFGTVTISLIEYLATYRSESTDKTEILSEYMLTKFHSFKLQREYVAGFIAGVKLPN